MRDALYILRRFRPIHLDFKRGHLFGRLLEHTNSISPAAWLSTESNYLKRVAEYPDLERICGTRYFTLLGIRFVVWYL